MSSWSTRNSQEIHLEVTGSLQATACAALQRLGTLTLSRILAGARGLQGLGEMEWLLHLFVSRIFSPPPMSLLQCLLGVSSVQKPIVGRLSEWVEQSLTLWFPGLSRWPVLFTWRGRDRSLHTVQGQNWQFALLCLPGLAEGWGGKVSTSKVDAYTAGGGAVWHSERGVAGRQQT